MNPDLPILAGRLFRVVGVLALPAPDQAACLERMGVAPLADELALELHDHVLLVDQFVEHGYLTPEDADGFRKLDGLLAQMSGPDKESLWTIDALKAAPEWASVRQEARSLLCRL